MPVDFVHANDETILRRHAEVFEFERIEFDSGFTQQLLQSDAAQVMADGETVGLGDLVKIVGGDDRAGAGHVLDDHRRIAWNMFAEVTRQRAGVEIVAAAGGEADDDADGFALVEVGWLSRVKVAGEKRQR